jgi:hypothetical protein
MNHVGEWVLFTERKPDKHGYYLVWTKNQSAHMELWNAEYNVFLGLRRRDITHWCKVQRPDG